MCIRYCTITGKLASVNKVVIAPRCIFPREMQMAKRVPTQRGHLPLGPIGGSFVVHVLSAVC